MQIMCETSPRAVIVSVTGRIDALTAPELEHAVHEKLEGGTPSVLLNLGGVEYISSAGLRSVLILLKAAKALGGGLSVCAMQPMVAEIFHLAQFVRLMPIYDTLADAQHALG